MALNAADARKYRLEVGVRRISQLVDMSSSARIVFSVRLPHFPDIFIRPQPRGGSVAVEFSPEGDRVLSVAYDVCHRAEFSLNNRECRAMFPTHCCCRLFDEALPEAAIASSTLTWLCPCPLIDQHTVNQFRCASFEMRTADGRVMGVAEMSCRVVPVECGTVSPASTFAAAPAASSPVRSTGSSGTISINGKPYIIRVVIDSRIFRKRGIRKGEKSHRHRSKRRHQREKKQPGRAIAVSPFIRPVEGEILPREVPQELTREGQEGQPNDQVPGKPMEWARKGTFHYFLKYNVAYQVQSNCMMLYTTLKRDFGTLNEFAIDECVRHTVDKIDRLTQSVLRLSNIVLQLATQLVDSTGTAGTVVVVDEEKYRIPVHKLPTSRKGSVAHFVVNRVLYQLQCVGAGLHQITSEHPKPLSVLLSSLNPQHMKFLKALVADFRSLTKRVNIMVQSTINGDFGSRDGFSKAASTTTRRSSGASGSGIPSGRGDKGLEADVRRGQIIPDITTPKREVGDVAVGKKEGCKDTPKAKAGGSTEENLDDNSSTITSSSTSSDFSSSSKSSSSVSNSSEDDQGVGSFSKSISSYTDTFNTTRSGSQGGSTVESIPSTHLSRKAQPTADNTWIMPSSTVQPQPYAGATTGGSVSGGAAASPQSVSLVPPPSPQPAAVASTQPSAFSSPRGPLPEPTAAKTTSASSCETYSSTSVTASSSSTTTVAATANQSLSHDAIGIPIVPPSVVKASTSTDGNAANGPVLNIGVPPAPNPVVTTAAASTSAIKTAPQSVNDDVASGPAVPLAPLTNQPATDSLVPKEPTLNVAALSVPSSLPLPSPPAPLVRTPTTPQAPVPTPPSHSARSMPVMTPRSVVAQSADGSASCLGKILGGSVPLVPVPTSPTSMPQLAGFSSVRPSSPLAPSPSARANTSTSLSLSTPGKTESISLAVPLPLPSVPLVSPTSPSLSPDAARSSVFLV